MTNYFGRSLMSVRTEAPGSQCFGILAYSSATVSTCCFGNNKPITKELRQEEAGKPELSGNYNRSQRKVENCPENWQNYLNMGRILHHRSRNYSLTMDIDLHANYNNALCTIPIENPFRMFTIKETKKNTDLRTTSGHNAPIALNVASCCVSSPKSGRQVCNPTGDEHIAETND
jgi:hypothetical protein